VTKIHHTTHNTELFKSKNYQKEKEEKKRRGKRTFSLVAISSLHTIVFRCCFF
jgi:hypothetical protein